MSLEEKLEHAREDLESVQRKYAHQLKKIEHDLAASRDKSVRMFHDDYRSPLKNNWLITIRVTKKRARMYPVVWWQFAETGLGAMTVTPDGSTFFFDTHFLQRYRERESAVPEAIGNMRLFFRTNHDITMKLLDTYRHGLREAAGIAVEGLFLGTVRPGGIIGCDTFLSQDMLHKDQQALRIELEHHAHSKHLSTAQLAQMRRWSEDLLRVINEQNE